DELAISLNQLADTIATASKGYVSIAVFPLMLDRDFAPNSAPPVEDTSLEGAASDTENVTETEDASPSSTDIQASELITATEAPTVTGAITVTGTVVTTTVANTGTSTATAVVKTTSMVVPPPPNAEAGDTWTNPADGSVYHFVAG
ncbi:MAG: hypothetical protein ACK2UO_13615, partial [Caldilineaceae bacterium]